MLQGFPVNFEEGPAAIPMRNDDDTEREELRQMLTEIGGNMRASSHYLSLARDLDVMEAKLPDEVRHAASTLVPIHSWAMDY